MKTKILSTEQITDAVSLLSQGELVALATETVYGLAADAKNPEAISKIFKAKGRPKQHPLILHIYSIDDIKEWADEVTTQAEILAKNFWPGPLTMLLKKKSNVDSLITGGQPNIAIRVPRHPVMLDVIKKLGNPIVAPSANAYKKISPTSPEHVLKTLENKISAIVDSGNTELGIESTIIDMTRSIPQILRPGAITKKMIEKVLNMKIYQPAHHEEKVSGNMKDHYQPDTQLFVSSLEEIMCLDEDGIAIMHYSEIQKNSNNAYYKMPKEKEAYAKKLYHTLHQIDNSNAKKILVERPPNLDIWLDVIDRLMKASTKL